MATQNLFKLIDEKYNFILSTHIKVFPSAYRGLDAAGNAFDPEARINSEFNFTNNGNTVDKKSYIISFEQVLGKFTLKVIVGGYYFEIFNLDADDKAAMPKWLNIKLNSAELVTDFKTPVLCNYKNSSISTLDVVQAAGEEYYFYGLNFSSDRDTSANYSVDTTVGSTYWLPITAEKVESFKPGTHITKNLIDGSKNNTVKLGDTTTADKDNLVAFGIYNTTAEDDLFVIGNGTTSDNKSNALSVNKNSTTINVPLTTYSKAIIAKDDDVELSAETKITTINGTLTVEKETNLNNNLNINTDKFNVVSSSGNTTIAGTITQGSSKNKQQVTFWGNVDAANGLDVTNDSLTVKNNGENKFEANTNGEVKISKSLAINSDKLKIDESGNILTNGSLIAKSTITLGETASDVTGTYARSAILLGKSDNTTNVLGKLTVDGTTQLNNTLNIGTEDNRQEINSFGKINAKNGLEVTNATLAAKNGLSVDGGTCKISSSTTISNTLSILETYMQTKFLSEQISFFDTTSQEDLTAYLTKTGTLKVKTLNTDTVSTDTVSATTSIDTKTLTATNDITTNRGNLNIEDGEANINDDIIIGRNNNIYLGTDVGAICKPYASSTKLIVLYDSTISTKPEKASIVFDGDCFKFKFN